MNNSFLLPKVKSFLISHSCFVYRVFFYLLLFSHIIWAQYRFDSFTTDNGLPQNGVRGIKQTPDGYLWFTTFDGLVRYDGAKFTVFDKNNSPGILSNRFSILHVEPDGTLFAGTEEGGLTVLRDGIFKTYTTADGLPSNIIVYFGTDAKGDFIIETAAGYCYFRDGGFIPVSSAEMPNKNLFYRSPTGNLWLYDKDSVRQITPDKREITYPIKLDYYNEGFSGVAFFEDSLGNVWFGDLSAVYRLKDGNISRFTTADGVPARTILRPYVEDADGSIWFASGWFGDAEKVGLVRFYDGQFTTWGESAGLSNPFVGQLFKDREGTIWGATNGGLNHLQKQFIKSYSVADGLIHSEVYPLLQTRNGDVYIGTTRGLSRYRDGKFSAVPVSDDKEDVFITALFEDERGALWIGTAGGLLRLENGIAKKIDYFKGTDVWTIVKTDAGEFWVGTNKGLFRFKDENSVTHFTTADGLPSDDVKIIHQARDGALWIGTYGGLVKMSASETSFTTIEGLASPRIRAIYEDADGVLWIGTYDGGLSRLKNGRAFSYTVENGLFNNGVFQILEDARGDFWISSNRGIYRVAKNELNDLADGKIPKINSVAYGKPDGMLNTECNGGRQPAGIKTADGKFWFPTQNGVVVINPEDVSLNATPPPVKIESVLIERQTTDFKNGIALNAKNDNLEIRYTGISFIKPEQVKFRYRIEGLDENWTDVGTIRDVYFPSLPSGEYTFHVIAANSDGVWNTEGAHLKIRVFAPFWQKAWFIVLCSMAVIAVIFLIFRLRERELKRRQFIQQEFSRRLIDSQENERKRIASELHDSLGQYLLAIKNWAQFGLNSVAEENPAREFLTEVSDTSSLALVEVREMTHNLRPYQLERLGLTNTLEYMLKNIKSTSSTSFSVDIENIDGILSKEAEIVFYRIAQETVNNVIKHSAAANAFFTVKRADYGLEFVCRDDGKGFDTEAAKTSPRSGLGLNGIAERVKILNGEYKIDSAIGKGTTVSVKIHKIDERRN
jgi:signal transduction histidine kinase/ligand-binding sensor domain-containing protein